MNFEEVVKNVSRLADGRFHSVNLNYVSISTSTNPGTLQCQAYIEGVGWAYGRDWETSFRDLMDRSMGIETPRGLDYKLEPTEGEKARLRNE